jgi:hypothetical protein
VYPTNYFNSNYMSLQEKSCIIGLHCLSNLSDLYTVRSASSSSSSLSYLHSLRACVGAHVNRFGGSITQLECILAVVFGVLMFRLQAGLGQTYNSLIRLLLQLVNGSDGVHGVWGI